MIRKLFYKTPLAWLQMSREKTRLAVAIVGIAFADILMFVQLGFKSALYDAAIRPQYSLQGDLFLINPQFETVFSVKSFSRQRLYQAAGFDGVKSVSYLYIDSGQWRNPINHIDRRILIFGIDPANSAFKLPEVDQHLDDLKMLNSVLFDQLGRTEYGPISTLIQQSDLLETEVNNVLIQVVGVFNLGASFAADGNAITSESTFMKLFPNRRTDQIDIGIIKLKSDADIEQVKANIQTILPPDIQVLRQDELATREKEYWANATPIGFIFGLGSVVAFIVGTVIVYQIIYADVSDHLPEYATLKAMGYSDRYLIIVIFQESLILAFIGFIPGCLLSLGVYHAAQISTRLPIMMTASRAIFVLLLTIMMCFMSGGIAINKLQKADPADIF
ncbi:MAG: ABC transporter permease DevC [Desmonostoc geniculatum HA4340-LM1]|jgi:putative ABC transport system permease protein|nr:ABC transporter permease DevC [Desmonostoc geniculatum HA4340-LM1]